MRLRKVSSWFFPIVLFALGANALLLGLIKQSYDTVVAAQDHRQSALGVTLADQLAADDDRTVFQQRYRTGLRRGVERQQARGCHEAQALDRHEVGDSKF